MTITAKYAATCPCCRAAITPGQQVEWTKGTPAKHTACASNGAAVAAAPARTAATAYGQRVGASRAAWGARRGMGAGHGAAGSVPGYSSYCTDNASCRCYDCAS